MPRQLPAQITPYQHYFHVLLLLFALTGLTVWLSTLDLGGLNIWMALAIASLKATFVLLFFMHLKDESRFLQGSFLCTIIILAIFIGFMFWDIAFR